MIQILRPATVVSPGRILSWELEARGWTQKDLAEIIGRPIQTINKIIRGTKQVTPETALELADAFNTSPEFWMNLEANYRLHLARKERDELDLERDEQEIVRKSRLYELAPISEITKRGWIQTTDLIDELEQSVCQFLGITSPEESS